MIRPINHNIMFQFLDSTGGQKGRFHGVTQSGIILMPTAGEQKKNKWGKVLAVGPKVEGIVEGDYILVESLMWMEGTKVDDVQMWKTDDSKIIVVTDDPTECELQ